MLKDFKPRRLHLQFTQMDELV